MHVRRTKTLRVNKLATRYKDYCVMLCVDVTHMLGLVCRLRKNWFWLWKRRQPTFYQATVW